MGNVSLWYTAAGFGYQRVEMVLTSLWIPAGIGSGFFHRDRIGPGFVLRWRSRLRLSHIAFKGKKNSDMCEMDGNAHIVDLFKLISRIYLTLFILA